MKLPRQFIVLVLIGLCLMIYFNYDSATEVENQPSKAPDKKSLEATPEPCKPKSFWEEYDIWGDTDTVYAPPSDADESKLKSEENETCDESIEPKK